MPAATRSDVNPSTGSGQVPATALIRVDAASVTLARDGSYQLLLRTSAGTGRFCVPLAVGAGVFKITNPSLASVPKGKPAYLSASAPTKQALAAAREEWLASETIGVTEVAAKHNVQAGSLRTNIIATVGHANYQERSALRGHKTRLTAKDVVVLDPILKPSGRIL